MSSLTQILINAGSGDPSLRDPATAQLDAAEKTDFAQYVAALCGEFGTEDRPREVRLLAALQLKNALIRPKNVEQSLILAERWLRLPETIRSQAKAMVLQTLASRDESVRSQASRVVAAIASIEVPKQQWNDIINILIQSIVQTANDGLRQAGFEALGYVCEEVPEYLQDKSNVVLNAIAIGLHPDLKDTKIKLAATRALVNSMNFIKANFQIPAERDTIMRMIYSVATYMEDVNVRVAAFSALVEVASSYYEYLGQFIAYIYQLTANAIANEKEEVQLQAIEFWSALCDEEIELLFDEEDGKSDRPCAQYISKAFPQLSQLLLMCLTKQSGNLDDQQWDVATAAATCLGLCAQAAKDAVVNPVLLFVQANIVATDWHMEEAAILAFGSILDGPKKENLQPLVSQALPLILSKMQHKNALVKDTTAWTLGRICQLVPETITPQILPQLMITFVNTLADVPKVAANVCWALHNLALAVEKNDDSNTSPLSTYMEGLMKALLGAANRPDVNQSNLLCSIYEAINILISTAAPDVYPLINHLIPELLSRLNKTIPASGSASEDYNEVQALLCASLAVIIQKFSADMIRPHADNLMFHFLRVLSSKSATVLEEAFMAIGYIANRVDSAFERYMNALKPFLLVGLSSANETKLCLVSVGLIGDISRAIGPQFIAMGDEVVKIFLEHLQSSTIDRSVKPHIISALGDIALALRGSFERYLVHVMRMLQQAGLTVFPDNQRDEDNIEYLQMLRESILEAYTGILQGLVDDKKIESFAASPCDGVQHVIQLLELIHKDRTIINDPILCAACGLIGDIVGGLGVHVVPLLRRSPAIFDLIDAASKSRKDQTVKAAQWAHSSFGPYLG